MKITVKITGRKRGSCGGFVFKIREQVVEKGGWKKLLYFSCRCGHKGQYKELNAKYSSCPKCERGVEILEKCPQCESPSKSASEAGITHHIYQRTGDDQVWEVWPCKKCQALLKNKARKFLGFVPGFLS